MAVSELFTDPATKQVAVGSLDSWAIDFTKALDNTDTIVSATARLERANAATPGDVGLFVTAASVGGKIVSVSWDGRRLVPGASYRLLVSATLADGAVVILATNVEAV